MIVHVTRLAFIAGGALGGLAVSRIVNWSEQTGFSEFFVLIVFIILGSSIGYVLGGILGRELAAAYTRLEERLYELSPGDLLLSATGLILGLVMALLVTVPLRYVEPRWLAFVATVLTFGMCAYVGMRVAMLKRDDFAHAFPRLSGQTIRPARGGGVPTKYLDTSAVIDGRFLEARAAGFLEGRIVVPRFVLAELQTLADSADDARRGRGRRGLDLLEANREASDSIDVFEIDYPDLSEVDEKLMRLAEQTKGAIVTVDHNLSKVARVKDLHVLNLNELAASLRPAYLPGDTIELLIAREGKEHTQGVGYLADGTMVVVHGGKDFIGQNIATEVTSVLQTSAGRMIFTKTRA